MFEITGSTLLYMRAMYLVAVVGAGVVGLLTLLAPRLAGQYIFGGSAIVNDYLRILAAVWIALGTAALLGVFAPAQYAPVLLIQLIYKTLWVVVVGLPALMRGNREAGLLFMTGLFTVWAIALLFAVPFGNLLPL